MTTANRVLFAIGVTGFVCTSALLGCSTDDTETTAVMDASTNSGDDGDADASTNSDDDGDADAPTNSDDDGDADASTNSDDDDDADASTHSDDGDAGAGASAGALLAPSDLHVRALVGTVGVLWRDRSDDETGFLVLRQDLPEGSDPDDEVDYTEVAEVAANVNTFLDGSVTPGEVYRYGVVAMRDGERSEILGPSVAVEPTSEGVPLVDPDDEVGTSLNQLGIDTTPTARVDGNGDALPDNFLPLGPQLTIDQRDELLVIGPNLDDNPSPQQIIELTDGGDNAFLSSAPFADYETALHAPRHQAAAGDFDGDGLDEILMVYVADATGNGVLNLQVRFVDDATTQFAEEAFDLGDTEEVAWVDAEAGDFNGNGRESPVVSLGRRLLFLGDYAEGFAVLDEQELDTVSDDVDVPVYVALAVGNFDNDSPKELALTINEITDTGLTRYQVRDDALNDYALLKGGQVEGTDGQDYTALVADVATGDVDDDGYDEIILGGLTAFSTTCSGISTLTVLLDDAISGNDLQVLGAKQKSVSLGLACDSGNVTTLRFVHVAAGNLDDDPADEFTVAHVVFDDWSRPFGEYGFLEPVGTFGDKTGALLDQLYSTIKIADLDGDGRGEIFPLVTGATRLDGFNVPTEVPDESLSLEPNQDFHWEISGKTHDARPLLVVANVDQDSTVAQAGSDTGLPDYELTFTEPIVLAVLAAAPCYESSSQNIDACSTSYGTGSSAERTVEGSISLQASVSFGAKAIGGALTQSELTAKLNVSLEHSFGFGKSYGVAKSVSFDTGPLQDAVVFTSVPIDIYRYTIVQHRDASKVGQVEEVRLPREPVTVMVERNYYNSALAPGEFAIDDRVFAHVAGAPHSYRTQAATDGLGGLVLDLDLQTGPQSVGQGTGSTSLSIDVSEEKFASSGFEISTEYELEVVGASVLSGFSIGASRSRSLTVTTGSTTSYGATVGDIADPEEFGADGYAYGIFTYRYEIPSGEQFHVIDFWVE